MVEEGGKMYVNTLLEAENWLDKIGNVIGKPFKWGFGLVEKEARKIKNYFEDSETLAKTRMSVREELQKQISDDNIPINKETEREYAALRFPNLVSEKEINDIIHKRSKSNAISQAGSEKKGEFNKSKEELVTAIKDLKEGTEMLIKLKEQKPSKVSKQDLSQHLQENGSTTVSPDDNPFHAKESITLNNSGKE